MKSSQKRSLLIATLLVVGLAMLTWHLLQEKSNHAHSFGPDILKMVSEESRLQFPPDATVVEFDDDGIGTFDRIWLAKVVFGKGGLETFRKTLSDKLDYPAIQVNGRHESTKWWQPESIDISRLYYIDESMVYVIASWRKDKKVEVYIKHAVY